MRHPGKENVRTLGTNPYWDYRVKESDRAGRHYFIDVPDSVLILAVSMHHRVLLVRQFRPVLGAETVEFPGGSLERGECIVDGARRELVEETGLEPASSPESVATLAPSTGCSTERCHVVAIAGLEESSARAEDGLEVLWIDRHEVASLLLGEEPIDAVALAAWAAFGERKAQRS